MGRTGWSSEGSVSGGKIGGGSGRQVDGAVRPPTAGRSLARSGLAFQTGLVRFVEEEAGEVDSGAVAASITLRPPNAEGVEVFSPHDAGAVSRGTVSVGAGGSMTLFPFRLPLVLTVLRVAGGLR